MNRLDEQELIRHAQSLRGLACVLVGPAHAADVAQEAAVVALTSKPDDPRTARSWLQSIVRHKAWKWRRRERRRRDRSRPLVGEPVAPSPTPVEIGVHREAVAALHDALMALPDAHQAVLLQRYFEDLTPTEIARRCGEPLATVKSRLQRGLAMLRRRLAQRSDWRAGLVAAFGITGAAAPKAVPAAGILIMTTMAKVLGAALAAIVLWWWLWPAGAPLAPTGGGGAKSGDGTVATSGIDRAEASPNAPRRVEVEGRTAAAGSRDAGRDESVVYFGRCVDESGAPLPGVRVEVRIVDSANGREAAVVQATTADDGAFELAAAALEDHGHMLELSRDGRCPIEGSFLREPAGKRIDLGQLVLPTACVVRGLVRGPTSAPDQGVTLRLSSKNERVNALVRPFLGDRRATTAGDGRFAFDGVVPPGDYVVRLGNRRAVGGEDPALTIASGQQTCELEISVEAAPPPCRGVVVDDAGSPIRDAVVWLSSGRSSPSVRTDVEGRFEITPDPNLADGYRIEAAADGYRDASQDWDPASAQSSVRVELVRLPGCRIRVVEGSSGRPVTRFAVWRLEHTGASNVPTLREADHPDGVAALSSPPGEYLLCVVPADERLVASPLTPVRIAEGRWNEVTIALSPAQTRRLVVRTPSGPAADVEVELFDMGGRRADTMSEIWPLGRCRVFGSPIASLLQNGATDGDGSLLLHGPAGPLGLRLSGGGIAQQFVQPVSLDERGDLVVLAERGATLRGHLRPADLALEVWQTAAGRQRTVPGIGLVDAEGDRIRIVTGLAASPGDRTFRYEGLPAGTYGVEVFGRIVVDTFTVGAGETLERDFDLSPWRPIDVTLDVLLDGEPVANTKVRGLGSHAADAFGERASARCKARTDASGRASLRCPAGELVVVVSHRDELGQPRVLVARVEVPDRPAVEHVVDLRSAWLDLRLRAADGSPAADAKLVLAMGSWTSRYTADASGRVRAPIASGEYRLSVEPRGERVDGQARPPQPVGDVTVAPGEGSTRELLLPPAWNP